MRDIRIIACVNKSRSIGNGGDLLYKLKGDLKRFKSLTNGNIVVMGRKTYESLPKKPLPNRVNIILTKQKDYKAEGCIVKSSLSEILDLYDKEYQDKILYVIGGGEIYNLFLSSDIVNSMELTFVDDMTEGNVRFPNVFDETQWEINNDKTTYIDEETNLKYHFSHFQRIR